MLWDGPPPCVASESMQSTEMPLARMRSARPPTRSSGPEKRIRTRFWEACWLDVGAATDGRPGG
eukprot:910038-Pleurochrysis_carterae.AAC.1